MSQRILSFHVSDLTATFFVGGKIYTVQSDHPHFKQVRELILTGQHDAAPLIELTDVKVSLKKADKQGLLEFVGGCLAYKGVILNNVWVDKIMGFRNAGLEFDPIFLALSSLLRNPSQRARERFPIFAERNRFGFLPDGRMMAFKAVKEDFTDIHSGKFDNSPGQLLEMPRSEVDDDPEHTCSNGFHVGAIGYVRTYGHEGRKVVATAFWPEDVVAVPVDYNGEKMRICRYEVLEEVDQASVDQFLAERELVIPVVAAEDEVLDDIIAFQDGYSDGWTDYDPGASASENADNFRPQGENEDNEGRGYRRGWDDRAAGKPFDNTYISEEVN